MADSTTIPIVDCAAVAVTIGDSAIASADLQICAEKIVEALSGIGFVYLRNHGIPKEQVKEAFRISKEFFSLETEIKQKYKAETWNMNDGFLEVGKEMLDPRYHEVRESFNMNFLTGFKFPAEVNGFEDVVTDFFASCSQLSRRILTLMGLGLQLKDKHLLNKCHSTDMTAKENRTTMRLIYYPPVVKKDDIIRCGEHSDYGSLTLLFQDDAGGLQVKNRDGNFVDATPIEDCVLINIGDLMQRWTADKLVSTKHRVLVPNLEELQKKSRYSIAFFVLPDNDVIVESLDNSNKYPPIKALDYLNKRLFDSYAAED